MAEIYYFPICKGDKHMGEASVLDIANFFLKSVDRESGGSITHLKLQKLIYYAQGWHLAFVGSPMFKSKIEAWVHGPVCPELYTVYAGSGFINLEEPDWPLYPFSSEQTETLEAVWKAYGDYDGKYLEELTHQEDPWQEARRGIAPWEHCNNEITIDSMKKYFMGLLENGQGN